MRVTVGHQPSVFRTKGGAPYLRPAEKESLSGSESIQGWRPLAFDLLFKSRIGNCQPSQVRDAFAQDQFSVLVEARLDFVAIKLLLNAGRAFIEVLAVLLGPPIAEIALTVKLRTGVVEAMGDFMADRSSHAAVVDGVIRLRIKKRRLQNPGGKNNFVHRGPIISVHSWRRHSPFGAVPRFANFVQTAGMFEADGSG